MASAPFRSYLEEDEDTLTDVSAAVFDRKQVEQPNYRAAESARSHSNDTRRETVAGDHPQVAAILRPPRTSLPDGKGRSPPRRRMGMVLRAQTCTDETSQSKRTIECSVCLQGFKDSGDCVPRNLSCGHTFCTGRCVSSWYDSISRSGLEFRGLGCVCVCVCERERERKRVRAIVLFLLFISPGCLRKLVHSFKIKCPKCSHLTTVDTKGASGLIKNYAIIEVVYTLPPKYSPLEEYPVSPEKRPGMFRLSLPLCKEHGDHLSSFCVKDMVLVCSSCLLYGSHKQHPCKLVTDATLDCHRILSSLIPDVIAQKEKMKDAVEHVQKEMKAVKEKSQQLSTQIDEHFDQLVSVLNARRKELQLDVLERSQVRVEALLQQLQ